jgi:2-methylisocitrate lyase-like PEP mutase family enzyme
VPDGGALDRDTTLDHVGRIVAAVRVPVTADLEAGYGDTVEDVARTVALAVEVGRAGGSQVHRYADRSRVSGFQSESPRGRLRDPG